MNICIISGSSRANSNTLRVAKAIQQIEPSSVIVDFTDFDFPNYNGNVDVLGETPFQKELIDAIEKADLLFVLTPEYNWFPSAEVIQMVHMLGTNKHASIFNNMTAAFVGVSAGRGGRMPAVQLGYVFDKIFQYFGLSSITSPKSFESQETQKCLDAEGKMLSNAAYNDGLTDFVNYSLNVAKRWRQVP